jgi:hypothetical protein
MALKIDLLWLLRWLLAPSFHHRNPPSFLAHKLHTSPCVEELQATQEQQKSIARQECSHRCGDQSQTYRLPQFHLPP